MQMIPLKLPREMVTAMLIDELKDIEGKASLCRFNIEHDQPDLLASNLAKLTRANFIASELRRALNPEIPE